MTSETECSASDNREEPTAIAETITFEETIIPTAYMTFTLFFEETEETIEEYEYEAETFEPAYLEGNGEFKPWMPHSALSRNTARYRLITKHGRPDENGLWLVGDRYYAVVMGPYYQNSIGDLWEIELCSGNVFHAVSGDSNTKARANTQVEFIVNRPTLNPRVRTSGSAGTLEHLSGSVVSVTYLGNWYVIYGGETIVGDIV